MNDQAPSLTGTDFRKALHQFKNGWHLDVAGRENEAHWIRPDGERIPITVAEAMFIVENLGSQLEAMYAPGHAYYVIGEPTIRYM